MKGFYLLLLSVNLYKFYQMQKLDVTIENERVLLDNNCTCCFRLMVDQSHGKA